MINANQIKSYNNLIYEKDVTYSGLQIRIMIMKSERLANVSNVSGENVNYIYSIFTAETTQYLAQYIQYLDTFLKATFDISLEEFGEEVAQSNADKHYLYKVITLKLKYLYHV